MSAKWIMMAPLCVAVLVEAEERHTGMVNSWPLANGLYAVANTYCDPPRTGENPFACLGQNGIEATILFHPDSHILMASRGRTWFGYSFTAEKTGKGDTIRMSIGPAGSAAGPAGYRQVPLPKYDAGPFTLAPGDILRMPLLVNPNTGQTLVDELQIFTHPVSNEEALGPTLNDGTSRDFALQDVQMRLIGGTLSVNGKEVRLPGGRRAIGATGQVIWYAKQGLGTTVLSFVPQAEPRFRKAGVIHGRTLRFQIGSDQYEWRCAEPVLPGDGEYNVYVYWDPAAKGHDLNFGSASTGEVALKVIATLKPE